MLRSLDKRLEDMDIRLSVSDAAVEKIAKAGFDPVYGARPLRRAIQSQLEDPLAEQMLEGKFRAGDTVNIDVDVEKDTFTFTSDKAPKAEEAAPENTAENTEKPAE